jgi:hypothetical protein
MSPVPVRRLLPVERISNPVAAFIALVNSRGGICGKGWGSLPRGPFTPLRRRRSWETAAAGRPRLLGSAAGVYSLCPLMTLTFQLPPEYETSTS